MYSITMKYWPVCSSRPGVEHLHDVGVHEARRRLRLALEARHERGVVGEVLGEQLDRHLALEAQVEREVHGGHPAEAQPALQAVAPGDLHRAHLPPSWPAPTPPPAPASPTPVAAPGGAAGRGFGATPGRGVPPPVAEGVVVGVVVGVRRRGGRGVVVVGVVAGVVVVVVAVVVVFAVVPSRSSADASWCAAHVRA